jgi:hypothetical protein
LGKLLKSSSKWSDHDPSLQPEVVHRQPSPPDRIAKDHPEHLESGVAERSRPEEWPHVAIAILVQNVQHFLESDDSLSSL